MPPEGLEGTLSTKWDIWSLGVVLFIIVTSQLPYEYEDKEELILCILNCEIEWASTFDLS